DDDLIIRVGEALQPCEAVADRAGAAAGADENGDTRPGQLWPERDLGERLAYSIQRDLGRPVGARQAERPLADLLAVPIPLVGPREHEHAGATGGERRPYLPVERPRLSTLAMAEAVEPELAHDERPVSCDVLQARQVRLEAVLRLEVHIEAHEVEKRQPEVLRGGVVHVGHEPL